MSKLVNQIVSKLIAFENPKRVPLSKRYPFFKKPILLVRFGIRHLQNFFDFKIRFTISDEFFDARVARHQSVLRRRLGDSDPRLQEQKITNLRKAVERLNGVIIQPGDVFSLWDIIGKPTYKNGYVDGMLLSNGKVVEGLGGGLCQLSNFLYWIFLHSPVETVERYHHSMDVFPDSGRTLPFGGGATILYNFVDLKLRNVSNQPLQLKIWLTENHLKGQIVSPNSIATKYHVVEKNHCFVKRGEKYFRYNEIFREAKIEGKVISVEKVTTNFAPVLYKVTSEYLESNNFKVIDLTGLNLEDFSK